MVVWLTPADREGLRWRIEVRPDGRVAVFRVSDRWVSSSPLRRVRTMDDLGRWMHERGLHPDDLTPA